jgi:arylsulfatase A-like enzyme
MNRWWSSMLRAAQGPARRKPLRRAPMALEKLEDRTMPSVSGAFDHVLLLSVDGLHQADVADPALNQYLQTIHALQQVGVTYTNAHTTSPSDSFPGTLSYLTGAGPGTTGVFYDDSYSRTLFAPGSNPATSKPGTEVTYFEAIDKDPTLISGGGNFDASSIDPTTLPVNSQGQPVYPNQFLKVNTIFDVAHDAGLYTAFSDKHPAYQIANGTDPNAINDFFGPEINSTTALLDPTTGKTVDANALLAANPFTDVSKYVLVDASTDPAGASDPNLINDTTHNLLLTEKYDDLKVQAILNEIAGKASHASSAITDPQVPALFGMNFQAVSVAEKYFLGGINLLPNGQEGAPSAILAAAMQHTDASIGKIVAALHNTTDPKTGDSLWDDTQLVVTAKHGQTPRVGVAGLMADSTLPNVLSAAGAPIAFTVQDDVSLLYLQDQGKTQTAVQALQDFEQNGTIDVFFQGTKVTLPASQIIDRILSGKELVQAGLGNPAKDSTTPDIIVTLKPGYIWVGNPTKFNFKRAEHGGFSDDDTHIALIVSGGLLPADLQGTVQTARVHTQQIAVSALEALGLNPHKLQGAVIDHTKGLPGLGLHEDEGDSGGKGGSDDPKEARDSGDGAQLDLETAARFLDSTPRGTVSDSSARIGPGDPSAGTPGLPWANTTLPGVGGGLTTWSRSGKFKITSSSEAVGTLGTDGLADENGLA